MQAENQIQNSENPKSETRKQKIEKLDLILLGNRTHDHKQNLITISNFMLEWH